VITARHVKNHRSETGGMIVLLIISKWFLTPGIPPIQPEVFEHYSHHQSKIGGIPLDKNDIIMIY